MNSGIQVWFKYTTGFWCVSINNSSKKQTDVHFPGFFIDTKV